jgi:septal ring factor EnvC (AmiA/AmiB activator)
MANPGFTDPGGARRRPSARVSAGAASGSDPITSSRSVSAWRPFYLGLAALITLLLTLPLAAEDTPPLPKYPERTADSLYQQLGLCNADLADTRKYMQMLAQEITKRDNEIERLKAELAKTTKPETK